MKKKSGILLIVGIVCLVIGGYLYMKNNDGSVDQNNIEIQRTATSAEDAARQISANNNSEIGGNSGAMFLLGLGGVLTIASIIGMTKKENQS